jgi:hypothetical protein
MRKQLALNRPEAALAGVLDALEQELIDASDEEILEAARDLGMNPMMKGSAAFLGLQFGVSARCSDFFDEESVRRIRVEAMRLAQARKDAS